jgi:hypothetical protein
MFATGTIGFLSSFYFVHYLFSSVKLDWEVCSKLSVLMIWFIEQGKGGAFGQLFAVQSALLRSLQGHNSMGANGDVITLEHLRRVVGDFA